jgi:class 3 adenylate cyclase
MKRSLAVVLYADVVGYSRLIGLNEDGTLETLAETLGMFTHLIESNNGKKIKEAGDAILAEFSSASDAVITAIEVQRIMSEGNSSLSENDRFEFRIGINLGEIVHDRNDIFGDGVNIAARIQGHAKPRFSTMNRCFSVKSRSG